MTGQNNTTFNFYVVIMLCYTDLLLNGLHLYVIYSLLSPININWISVDQHFPNRLHPGFNCHHCPLHIFERDDFRLYIQERTSISSFFFDLADLFRIIPPESS